MLYDKTEEIEFQNKNEGNKNRVAYGSVCTKFPESYYKGQYLCLFNQTS